MFKQRHLSQADKAARNLGLSLTTSQLAEVVRDSIGPEENDVEDCRFDFDDHILAHAEAIGLDLGFMVLAYFPGFQAIEATIKQHGFDAAQKAIYDLADGLTYYHYDAPEYR